MSRKIELATAPHGAYIKTVEHGKLKDTPAETIDQYLRELMDHQIEWAQKVPIRERIELLKQVLINIDEYKEDWAKADIIARRIPQDHFEVPSSYLGPAEAGLYTRLAIEILQKIKSHGGYKPFAKAKKDRDRVIVKSFPRHFKESLAFTGWRGEIHLEKGTKVEDLPSLQAKYYKDDRYEGGIALVLAAGNVSSLAISDMYSKLINEKKVVIIKVHPVLEYMGDILTKIYEPFIKRGFLRIVVGGSLEGHYLTQHPLVDEIHLTGSDKTFEAIVYGVGEEGEKNKRADKRITDKPVSGELGCVAPIIVVPGEWKERDYEYQADNIFSMLSIYNGYTCVTARVLILPKNWEGSAKLIAKLEERMAQMPLPVHYYPGTSATVEAAMACYPNMEKFGKLTSVTQPWMFAKGLDSRKKEVAFSREFWSSFMAQTYIGGDTKEEYLNNAVKFANEKLWGTLAAVIIVDPKTQRKMKKAMKKAVDDLRYGTVIFNSYAGLALALGTSPWGGYPGATYKDIQSGNSWATNAFMLDKIEKSVVYAPFHISPKPIWFPQENPNIKAVKAFTDFYINNKLKDFGRLLYHIFRH